MALGELLLAKNLIDKNQLLTVLEQQKIAGGRIGDNLVALGYITRERLEEVLQEPPPVPKSIAETGLDTNFLNASLLRLMYISALQTVPDLSDQFKLSRTIVEELLNIAKKDALVEVRGATDSNYNILRYALTNLGRERASEALRRCEYIGPAPIPLTTYQIQVQKQTITNERVHADALSKTLSHLVLSGDTLRRLGPAANSGRAILLYGASGNGKTSLAEALGDTFQQCIYIPYSIEADGQIIKIFDPAVHRPMTSQNHSGNSQSKPIYLPQMEYDPRWVRCRRPVIISGGELTLEMLDLEFDLHSKYYEAPLQVKATGGVFIIDDFGRQRVRPHDLLNRWIFPLERKLDFLTLHTGKKFELLFDQLVIFATNFPPDELMDPAMLRRVHYKLNVNPPNLEDYKEIFRRICEMYRLEYSEDIISYLVNSFYNEHKVPLAAFHPKFIVEHVIAACNYVGQPPRLTQQLLADALENLYVAPSSTSEG